MRLRPLLITNTCVPVLGLFAAMIGLTWLVLWFTGLAPTWGAEVVTVKTNMAFGQLLAGITLLLLAPLDCHPLRKRLAIVAASGVFLLGALTLSEHLFGYDLGIDQLLATEPPGAVGVVSPNRMGPPGSTSLMLLGLGLLALAFERPRPAAWAGVGVCIINMVPAVGFLYGVEEFNGNPRLTVIAWSSVIALLAVGAGLFLARPAQGPTAQLLRDDAGGVLLRRLLPAMILIPLGLGFLCVQGEARGFYGTAVGTGTLMIVIIVGFLFVLWRTAAALSHSAMEKAKVDAEVSSVALFPEENPFPVLRVREDGILLYANRSATGLLAAWGCRVGECVPEFFREVAGKARNQGRREQLEVQVAERDLCLTAVPVEGRNYTNIYGADVTDRRHAEEALREERDRKERILRSITDSFFTVDDEWRFTYVNAEAERVMSRPAGELLGQSVWGLFAGAEGFKRQFEQAAATGQAVAFEEFYAPLDGWFEVHAYPSSEGLSVYFRNVTERRRAAEALQSSERRYRSLFESIDEGFCVIEVIFDSNQKAVDYRFLEVNPAFERLTGISNAVGRSMREIAPQHEQHWFEIYGKVALTGESIRFQNPAQQLGRYYDLYAFRVGAPAERKVSVLFNDISARKTVEAALRQERDFSTAVLETAGALVVVLDRAGRICRFNRACVALTGYSEQEVLWREFWFLFSPEDLPGVKLEWESLIAGETPTQHENYWVASDGTRRLIAWSNAAMTSSSGRIEHIIATGVDISERNRALQALKEGERRMARAQAIAHLGSWELDLLTKQLAWSDEVYRILGFEPQSFEPSYEAFLNAVHPEDRAAVDAAYSGSLLERRDGYDLEHRVVHAATGEVRIVHERCEHLRDDSGRIVRSQGMVHDVTDRRRAEEALERSEARLAQGVQVAGLGIFEHDHISDVVEFSSGKRKLLGFSDDEVVTISGIVQKVAPEDREFLADMIRRAHDPSGNGHFEVDYRVPDGSGGVRWVSARSQTFFGGEGSERRPVRTIGAALDITERKEAQSRLERLVAERTAQLADANANLEHFAHTAAHDLRSPLRGINGFAAVMLEQYGQQLDEMGRSMLERIIGSATQMGQLLNDLLEYSRLAHTELRLETVSLENVVRDALALQDTEIRTRQAQVDVTAALPQVIGHQATIVMVVANLLSNGLKFTAREVRPRLRVWAEVQESHAFTGSASNQDTEGAQSRMVRLWVEDNGIGIKAEDQAKVFGVFQRLHGKSAYPGTGLGLAIVKKAVERMGGHVGVESEFGKGSRFWVELRAAE